MRAHASGVDARLEVDDLLGHVFDVLASLRDVAEFLDGVERLSILGWLDLQHERDEWRASELGFLAFDEAAPRLDDVDRLGAARSTSRVVIVSSAVVMTSRRSRCT